MTQPDRMEGLEEEQVLVATVAEANKLSNHGIRVSAMKVDIERSVLALRIRYDETAPSAGSMDLIFSLPAAWQLAQLLKKSIRRYLKQSK